MNPLISNLEMQIEFKARHILLCVWFFYSCGGGQGENQECYESEMSTQLVVIDSVILKLDTLSNGGMAFFYNEFLNDSYIGFYNHFTHCIYIYDYRRQLRLRIISLAHEGPDFISRNLSGVFIRDLDHIYVFEKPSGNLKIIDGNGAIKKVLSIFSRSDFGLKSPPDTKLSKPIIFNNNSLYLTGLSIGLEPISDHTKLLNAYRIDLGTGDVFEFLGRPSVYNTGQFGFVSCYQLFSCENLDNSGILYSFGLSKNVLEYKYDGTLLKHCMKSQFIEEIEPYSNDYLDFDPNVARMQIFDDEVSNYMYISALRRSNCYIRVNSIAGSSHDIPRRFSISIFNSNFHKIGECQIGEKVSFGYNVFSNEKGLHFMSSANVEEQVKFYIYDVL